MANGEKVAAQHLPGKWEIYGTSEHMEIWNQNEIGAKDSLVAILPGVRPFHPEFQASASLIAAAPELLAACRAYFGEGVDKTANLHKIMADAIAKATGRA